MNKTDYEIIKNNNAYELYSKYMPFLKKEAYRTSQKISLHYDYEDILSEYYFVVVQVVKYLDATKIKNKLSFSAYVPLKQYIHQQNRKFMEAKIKEDKVVKKYIDKKYFSTSSNYYCDVDMFNEIKRIIQTNSNKELAYIGELYLSGNTNKEIANQLGYSVRQVNCRINRIKEYCYASF